jgi:endonuclease/exonuclease/phosphatase family metal-dependent hydrolase
MDGPFTVISSNIRYDNPADGPHAWPQRRAGLAGLLRAHGAAVIATQEGRQLQLVELDQALPGHVLVETHREWISERMYPSLFVRRGLRVEGSGDVWLSSTPDIPGSVSFGSAFPRLCTWARVRTGETTLVCVSAHLDHLQRDTRHRQAEVMAQELAKLLGPEDHLVLMGDFNEGAGGQVHAALKATFPQLIDPWIVNGCKEEVSHHRFGEHHENGARIDWILTDMRLRAEEIFFDKSCPDGVWPSDHYPLVCRLSL